MFVTNASARFYPAMAGAVPGRILYVAMQAGGRPSTAGTGIRGEL
jgi:hypothetical protein